MTTRVGFLFFIALTAWPVMAMAQQPLDPGQCILDALKTAPKDSAMMIRASCVREYIRAMEPKAASLPLPDFAISRLAWFATMSAFPSPIPEHIIVTVKNDSPDMIISAQIVLMEKKSKKTQVYKAYADYPIDPGTVGQFQTDVLTGLSTLQEFTKQYEWGYAAVYGVPR